MDCPSSLRCRVESWHSGLDNEACCRLTLKLFRHPHCKPAAFSVSVPHTILPVWMPAAHFSMMIEKMQTVRGVGRSKSNESARSIATNDNTAGTAFTLLWVCISFFLFCPRMPLIVDHSGWLTLFLNINHLQHTWAKILCKTQYKT